MSKDDKTSGSEPADAGSLERDGSALLEAFQEVNRHIESLYSIAARGGWVSLTEARVAQRRIIEEILAESQNTKLSGPAGGKEQNESE